MLTTTPFFRCVQILQRQQTLHEPQDIFWTRPGAGTILPLYLYSEMIADLHYLDINPSAATIPNAG